MPESSEIHGEEGARNAQATPEIADDAHKEQTQTPAPADDVGVPSAEELDENERATKNE